MYNVASHCSMCNLEVTDDGKEFTEFTDASMSPKMMLA